MSRAERASATTRHGGSRRFGRLAVLVVGLAALGSWTPFRMIDPDVEAGNRAYAEGRYADALEAYDRAGRRRGVDADGLAFDRGTVELKQADVAKDPAEKRRLTERALEDLSQAGRSKDPHLRGAASYNRGNALLQHDKLDDAIEAYKQALREDDKLEDARLNLELALRRRQNQAKQQQQQQQQQQGQGGQGQQGQGQQGQPGQGSQGQQGQQSQGSDANPQDGSGGGANPQNGSNGGGGSNQQNDAQNGANRGGGSNQSQPGSNGEGSDAQGSNQSTDRNGQPGNPQPKRPPRSRPQAPKTPSDRKLDDLDDNSRRLQKDGARKRATGRAADPQHDW